MFKRKLSSPVTLVSSSQTAHDFKIPPHRHGVTVAGNTVMTAYLNSTRYDLKIITPAKPKYEEWNNRGVNQRFNGTPSEIIPVTTTEELTNALQYAVDKNYRVPSGVADIALKTL